ncbi:hypothetical protein CENSYa_2044 [Cenarchaeum symbiosum A]|uniref:Uncharacterized protein n=1 Tax=Cenarchaeum symbiosum (strain A) TaxID=414004 RepID=A0RZ80_CENSY|nr:hypothetical protein CENSYa_2044 [Cenarchaeum symbiosum A]
MIVFAYGPEPEPEMEQAPGRHQTIWSGPIGILQYEHRLGENVFYIMRGLRADDQGAVGIFSPEGILYRSFQYDGSKKSEFNQYFFPDTSAALKICTPEQLVGTWRVVFANNEYPPLEFVMTDEYIPGGEGTIGTVC